MSIEAMKQALEALKLIDEAMPFPVAKHAMLTLRTAIEQAEKQEPVAWANINKHGDITHTNNKRMPWSKTPLYTTPPAAQRQPLTEEQIKALFPSPDGSAEADVVKVEVSPGIWGIEYSEIDAWSYPLVLQVARAIEAAHGIGEKT